MLLARALVCAAISALNSAPNRWEIVSNFAFVASSFAFVAPTFAFLAPSVVFVASNCTPRLKAVHPRGQLVDTAVQPAELSTENREAGDHHDQYSNDDVAETGDGYI